MHRHDKTYLILTTTTKKKNLLNK